MSIDKDNDKSACGALGLLDNLHSPTRGLALELIVLSEKLFIPFLARKDCLSAFGGSCLDDVVAVRPTSRMTM